MICQKFIGVIHILLLALHWHMNYSLGQNLEGDGVKLTCHGALAVWAHKMMGEILKCNAELNNDEVNRMRMPKKAWKLPPMDCMFKCAGIKIGLLSQLMSKLGDDGSIDEKKAFTFVDDHVYEEYQELAYDILGGCFVEHGEVDPKEADCKSYNGMFRCITKAAPKIRKACYGY